MRLLVVDDEKLFLEFLVEHLKEMGFSDVTLATSGEEALQMIAAASQPFDCFLLDIKMPGMDGIQLCAEIRAMTEYRSAPIIMITSADAKTHMQNAFDAGATDYLPKPIETIDLRVRIQVALMLVETLSSEAESRKTLESTLRSSPVSDERYLGMRTTFSNVGNMRDFFQLENRLYRLGNGLFNVTLLSVEVNGIQKMTKHLNKREFLSTIHSVSQILDKTLPASGTTISYLGYGKFLCLVIVRNHIVPQLLQARIQDKFSTFVSKYMEFSQSELNLEVAALSSHRILSPSRALSLIHRYVGNMGTSEDALLPPIANSTNRIFSKLGNLR